MRSNGPHPYFARFGRFKDGGIGIVVGVRKADVGKAIVEPVGGVSHAPHAFGWSGLSVIVAVQVLVEVWRARWIVGFKQAQRVLGTTGVQLIVFVLCYDLAAEGDNALALLDQP